MGDALGDRKVKHFLGLFPYYFPTNLMDSPLPKLQMLQAFPGSQMLSPVLSASSIMARNSDSAAGM